MFHKSHTHLSAQGSSRTPHNQNHCSVSLPQSPTFHCLHICTVTLNTRREVSKVKGNNPTQAVWYLSIMCPFYSPPVVVWRSAVPSSSSETGVDLVRSKSVLARTTATIRVATTARATYQMLNSSPFRIKGTTGGSGENKLIFIH